MPPELQYTPQSTRHRAELCKQAEFALEGAVRAIKELDPQDQTLPALKLAIANERLRLGQRSVTLERRYLGMQAD